MSPARTAAALLLSILLSTLAASTVSHRVDYAVTVWLQHILLPMDLPAGLLVLLGNAEVIIPAVALAGALWALRNRTEALWLLALAGGLAAMSLVAVALKHAIGHPGPPPWLQRPAPRSGVSLHQTPFSFPSGHTIRTTMLAGLLLPRRWSAGIRVFCAGLPVLCMMTALVYLGDHWLTDVLGGLCLGWAAVEIVPAIDKRRR